MIRLTKTLGNEYNVQVNGHREPSMTAFYDGEATFRYTPERKWHWHSGSVTTRNSLSSSFLRRVRPGSGAHVRLVKVVLDEIARAENAALHSGGYV